LGLLILKHQQRAAQEKRASFVRGVFTLGSSTIFERLKDRAFQKKLTAQRELSSWLMTGKVGTKVDVPITSKIHQSFCFIPSGAFVMGSPEDEEPGDDSFVDQVDVVLTKSFWLAKTEVTQGQWVAVMNSNPSNFKRANLPVENVSWEDAQAFIAKLNDKQSLPQGWKFALPTEAQWEYACRAGEKGPYSGGSLDEVGWGGMMPTVAARRMRWPRKSRTHGDCMTCTATWGSGVLTGMKTR
jgi:formylglycine-generating enzyme required for sulfatase activity